MKWWKVLIAFGAVVILIVAALLGVYWQSREHIEIKMLQTEGGSKAWCAVVPSFELLSGSETTLLTSFRAQPKSNYVVVYGDGKPDGDLDVTAGGVITLVHELSPGWNEIYFSYAQAVPECWSVYAVKLWVPYFKYPFEQQQPQQMPVPVIERQVAKVPVMNVQAIEVEDKTVCHVAPDFKLHEDTLQVTFVARPQSAYVFSDGVKIDQVVVQEEGPIEARLKMHPGTNLAYFSYVEAKPECWSEYSVRIDLN
jgi:hypothetical protein